MLVHRSDPVFYWAVEWELLGGDDEVDQYDPSWIGHLLKHGFDSRALWERKEVLVFFDLHREMV